MAGAWGSTLAMHSSEKGGFSYKEGISKWDSSRLTDDYVGFILHYTGLYRWLTSDSQREGTFVNDCDAG